MMQGKKVEEAVGEKSGGSGDLLRRKRRRHERNTKETEGSAPLESRLDSDANDGVESPERQENGGRPGPSGRSGEGNVRADQDTSGDDEWQGVVQEKDYVKGDKQERRGGSKRLSKEKLEKLNEKYRKRGVVYISRIPPHLKPLKLRHMLEPFGEVLRIYLAPEDSAIRARRKRAGGDSGKNFTEGWVEFAKKSVAKRVADMLNGQPMGGPRRSAYHYDLWNLKYLHKFKWDNLTEEIAYRNAVREQRLAAEISSAKRERDFYLAKVDQSRAFSAMDERRKKQKAGAVAATADTEAKPVVPSADDTVKVRRRFPQRSAVAALDQESRPLLSSSVLSKVFSSSGTGT